ncbi:MAG: hypothetical protein NTU88_15170 [Armatimonadetes bacterium]|nr:hypothetical protein [Armatimonadota bacterium]
MSPQDQLLSQVVLYVGLGIGLLCMVAAMAIEICMRRRGKVTRKDVRDLVTGVLFIAVFVAVLMLVGRAKPSGKMPAVVDALFAAVYMSIAISAVSRLIDHGTEAVGALASGGGLRLVFWLITDAAAITIVAFFIMHFLPASWVLRVIAVFVGSVAGLIWRGVQLTRANRPEEPPEAESLIIKASS